MRTFLYVALGIGIYEYLRESIAKSVRENVPIVFQREFDNRTEFVGILGPVLGTPAVSRALGAVAEKSVLDKLPTIFGRRDYTPIRAR